MLGLTRRGFVGGAVVLAAPRISFSQEMKEITIAVSSTSMAAAVTRIAAELGLFEKNGLSVKNTTMESGNAATTALISQSVNFAISGPSEMIGAQARGQKVLAVATAYGSVAGVVVLDKKVADKLPVKADAPIADRMKAMDGLLVAAISPTSISPLGIRLAAKDAGGNLRYTYMSQEAMPAALESGAVQGIVASAPMWAAPVAKGGAIRWMTAAEIPYKFRTTHAVSVQVMKSFADQNPDLVKRVNQVMQDLNSVIDTRPDDVKRAVTKLYPKVDAQSIDLLFAVEAPLWKSRAITEDDMAHEMELVKGVTVKEDLLKGLKPADMLYRV